VDVAEDWKFVGKRMVIVLEANFGGNFGSGVVGLHVLGSLW